MLRLRLDDSRTRAARKALEVHDEQLATAIRQFQFRDIRPKAASEIADIREASALFGHSDKRISRRFTDASAKSLNRPADNNDAETMRIMRK